MHPRNLKFTSTLFLGLLVLLFFPWLIYSEVLQYSYVSFDDSIHIYRNEIYNPFSWKKIGDVWLHLKNGLYVPVAYTFWGIFIKLMSLTGQPLEHSAGWFHGLNLILHAANGALVYLLLRKLIISPGPALLGSLLFSVHPLQVESVAWISSFDGLLATFFGLWASLSWLEFLSQGRRRTYFLFILTASLSLLSKPSAVSWPLIFLSLVWYQDSKRLWKRVLQLLPVFGLAILIIVLTRLGQPENQLRFVTPILERPLVVADSLLFYISKLFLPINLTVNYGRTPDWVLSSPWAYLKLGALISLLYIFGRVKISRVYKLGVCVFVLALIPNLGLIPFNFQKYSSVADRYAYVAVIGVAICMVKILSENARSVVKLCMLLIVAILALQSKIQLQTWRNDTVLVYQMARAAPNFYHHSNLAQMLWAEMEGTNPLPMLAPRPLSIPLTQNQFIGRIAEIKFHFEQALGFEPEDLGTRGQYYQFLSAYGEPALRESWLSELQKTQNKVYKESTARLND